MVLVIGAVVAVVIAIGGGAVAVVNVVADVTGS